MDIEDSIDKKSRLEQGIFFTKHHIVKMIESNFDFTNIETVIDSAAGSCNFLIDLAIRFPQKKFYGVEKNPIIYKAVLKEIKNIPNIYYFNGDILLDRFPIPKCDLYLGNPPFINFSDLCENYRNDIKPLWLNYFPNSKGFKMLLGESRGDIAQLIFAHSVELYLKEGGEMGVILPNSLIKGNSASAGFREFNNIKVNKLVDISKSNPFDNTERNCFFILGEKGLNTQYPIKYFTQDREVNLIKSGSDLVEDGRAILKKSEYTARQGVNTLGANSIFIFKSQPPFKSDLIKPLLKSSDITGFNCTPSYFILYPYKNGKPIAEEDLKKNYSNEYNYLFKNKETLSNRKSRFVNKCWYGLFGVGEYTEKEYKVVWRGLGAKELLVSVTYNVIPNQAMNCYISTDSEDEAFFISGIMNSKIYKDQLLNLNESGAKSFAQPATINKIYIPKYNKSNEIHLNISGISKSLHKKIVYEKMNKLNQLSEILYRDEGFI